MAQYQHVIDTLRDAFPEIAQMLKDAEPDLTAFAAFPREHWTKIWSNNPIERLNREIKRRADVAPGLPRQRLRTPPDRLRPARATRSGSTENADTSPRPPCSA